MSWIISFLVSCIITVGGLYFVIRWMMKVNEKLDTIVNALDTDQKNDT